jgi:O-antigen/teichoic acid export membrane protein
MMQYLIRNSTLRLVSFGIGIVFALFVTPVIIGAVGQAAYGVWALISATVANYLLLDFGLSQAVSKFVAAAMARKDQEAIDRICSTGIALNIISCLLSFIITIALLYFGKDHIPQGTDFAQVQTYFAVYAGTFSLLFLFRTWNGVLAAEMRWTLLAFISMVKNVIVSLSVLIWISGENGLMFLSVVNGAGFLLEGVAYWIFARRGFSVNIRPWHVDWKLAGELLKFGFTSLVAQLGQAMRFRSQPYIIVKTIGAEGVAVFSIATQLITYFTNLIRSAFGIFIPHFSRLQAQGDSDGIRQSMLSALWLSYRVSAYVGLCLVFYGGDFVDLWLGPEFRDVQLVLVPMAIGSIFSTAIIPAQEFLMGISQHRITAICNIGEGVCVVLSSMISMMYWGIIGVGWSFFICAFIFRGYLLPYYAFRQANLSIFNYMQLVLCVALTHVLPQWIFWIVVRDYMGTGYLSLFAMSVMQGVVIIVVQYGLFRLDRRLIGFVDAVRT